MARMIGKMQWHPQCPYECCRGEIPKDTVRRREERDWMQDYEAELEYEAQEREFNERHARGICKNNNGSWGCDRCYDDSPQADAFDLEHIEGVTSNFGKVDID